MMDLLCNKEVNNPWREAPTDI